MILNMANLEKLLLNIPTLRVGLIGDGCVDIYWEADMRLSELSREVPHYPLPVVEERFSLGAGANVLSNLVTLGATNVKFVSIIGNDWRSTVFMNLLNRFGVSGEYLVSSDDIITPAYCKPIRKGISPVQYEDPRIDFINLSPISTQLEEQLIQQIHRIADESDVLIVCDQFMNGCITDAIIACINELGKKITIFVDSRSRVSQFRNVIVKPNEIEACHSVGLEICEVSNLDTVFDIAASLEKRNRKPALITLGENGAVWCENGRCTHVPAFPVAPPIDFVGAGDSFLAGFALAHSLHVPPDEALSFASLVASVTVKKIGSTGMATPDEVRHAMQYYHNARCTAKIDV